MKAKQFFGSVKNKAAVAGALALGMAMNMAHAAVDIEPEVTAAKSDINAAGLLIIGVVVACAVFTWVRRVIK